MEGAFFFGVDAAHSVGHIGTTVGGADNYELVHFSLQRNINREYFFFTRTVKNRKKIASEEEYQNHKNRKKLASEEEYQNRKKP